MKRYLALLLCLFANGAVVVANAQSCGTAPLQLQVLTSGGPEWVDARTASAILLWVRDKPRLLIDAGPGAALRFAQTGAQMSDIDALLFTHLRAERTSDLPALLQLASPTRARSLPIYGPAGNRFMPSTVSLVRTLFDPTRGTWRHLGDFLSPLTRASYKLDPHDLRPQQPGIGVSRDKREQALSAFTNERLRVTALPFPYGDSPALTWRIEAEGRQIVIAGHSDLNGGTLERFARGADVLVLPHIVMEETAISEHVVEMTPTAIGRLAHAAGVKHLVLTPRTHATLGRESETTSLVRRHYNGTLTLASDLDCLGF